MTKSQNYGFNEYLPYFVGTAAIAIDMLLELILLAWVEEVNLGSLKCHLKFCGVNGMNFLFCFLYSTLHIRILTCDLYS